MDFTYPAYLTWFMTAERLKHFEGIILGKLLVRELQHDVRNFWSE